MSQIEKLVNRFQTKPKDFSWDELTKILAHYGFEEVSTGKTSGSRRAFINRDTKQVIRLHKPHPGNVVKQYVINDVIEQLGL